MQKVVVTLVDDIDGTEAAETVKWSLDGVDYEIDLSGDNAQKLRGRLKEFKQFSRIVTKRGGKRTTRPMTEPAGDGATYSRHQGGVDPAAARAWAIKEGLIPKDQRGRLGTKYKDAYNAFDKRGDRGPLEKLKEELENAVETPAPPTLRPAGSPALQAAKEAEEKASQKQKPAPAVRVTESADPVAKEDDASPASEDPREAEAKKHYTPLTVHDHITGDLAESKIWKNRTAGGDKIEKLTLVERIDALTDFNLRILGAFLGLSGKRKQDGTISGLNTSVSRLQNLEMVRYAPDAQDGWEITEFGRYAYEVRSMA